MRADSSSAGFTIVEVAIATGLVATVATGVAALLAVAVDGVRRAEDQTTTVVLAMQKMEQLRALTFGLDSVLTDQTTDLSAAPWTSAGAGLRPSPVGTLDENTPGYVDYLDRRGTWVGNGPAMPSDAAFVRRWSVQSLPPLGDNTLLLQVLVTTRRREALLDRRGGPRRRYAEDAVLQSIKTKKGS